MDAAYFSVRACFNDRGVRRGTPLSSLAHSVGLRRGGGVFAIVWVLLAAVTLSACDESFNGPAELVPARLTPTLDTLAVLSDGDAIELQPPIQGGWVLFVGALLRNVSGKGASLLGELRRGSAPDGTPLTEPGAILYSEERTVAVDDLLPPTLAPTADPGWKMTRPDPNNTANIATCPNPLDVAIVDSSLYLRLVYRDQAGRTASAVRRVTPRCRQTDAQAQQLCACDCAAMSQPGKCTIR